MLFFELFPAFMLIASAIIGVALFVRNLRDAPEDQKPETED